MSESLSPLHPSPGKPRASSSIHANAPEEDLRRLTEHVRSWLSGSVNGASTERCFGVVTGEPGCGQRELFGAIEDLCRDQGMTVFHLSAYPDAGAPPGLTGALVRQLLDSLSSGDATGGRRRRMAGPNAEPFHDVLLEVAAPGRGAAAPDSAPDPEQHRLRLVDAVVCALLKVASDEPVILLLEDLEGADDLFRDLFSHLARMLNARRERGCPPTLLAIVGIPDRPRSGPSFGMPGEATDELVAFAMELRGYAASDLGRLSDGIVAEELMPFVLEAALRRTGGNVSHVGWLRRCAVGELRSGGWRGDRDAWNRLLSWSVPQLVARCFAQLTEEEARLVATLAVLDAAVPVHLALQLSRTAGAADETPDGPPTQTAGVPSELDVLWETGWVTLGRGGASEVSLSDAGVARVVRESLSPGELRTLRHRAVRILQREAGEDPRWLSHVLRQGIEVSNGVPGEETLEDETLRAAASYLPRVASPPDALRRLDDVVRARAGADSSGRAAWLELSARLLRAAGETKRAIEVYRDVRDSTGEAQAKARCCREIGDLMRELDLSQPRLEAYEEGLSLLAGTDDGGERLRLLCSVARAYLEAGRMAPARAAVHRCVQLVEGGRDVTREECLEVYRLTLESSPGGEPAAGDRLERAVARSRPGGAALRRFRTLCGIAQVHRERGRLDRELAFLKEAIGAALESGSRALVAEATWRRARAVQERGGGLKAMAELRRSLEVFSDLGDSASEQRINGLLLLFDLESGKLSRAGRRARALADSWTRSTTAVSSSVRTPASALAGPRLDSGATAGAFSLVVLARSALLEGDFDRTERDTERAMRQLGDSADSEVVVAASRTAAQLSLIRGDLARAYSENLLGLRSALEARSPDGAAEALLGLCEFFLHGGAFATAAGAARGGLALLRVAGSSRCELPLRRHLARLAMEVGDARRVAEEFDKAARLAAPLDSSSETCGLLLERGWERFGSGDAQTASSVADQGLQIARRSGFGPLRVELLHLAGTVAGASRDSCSRAADMLEEALAESRARALRRLEWEVLRSMASLYESLGKSESARESALRADEIETGVLGELPHMLRGIRWHSRTAWVSLRRRKTAPSTCAG